VKLPLTDRQVGRDAGADVHAQTRGRRARARGEPGVIAGTHSDQLSRCRRWISRRLELVRRSIHAAAIGSAGEAARWWNTAALIDHPSRPISQQVKGE